MGMFKAFGSYSNVPIFYQRGFIFGQNKSNSPLTNWYLLCVFHVHAIYYTFPNKNVKRCVS